MQRAFLVILSFVFVVGVVYGDWCAHVLNDDRAKMYNVTDVTVQSALNDTRGVYTMNLCHSLPCGSYTSCQICQEVGGAYCTATPGGIYSVLPTQYSAYFGYKMFFYGDHTYCPANKRRESNVYVLCGQGEDSLIYLGEPRSCEYEYEVHVAGPCPFNPLVPSLQWTAQSSGAIQISILQDPHLVSVDYLTIQYVVWVNDNVQPIYQGSYTSFVADQLPQGATNYVFRVKAIYNGVSSPVSQNYTVPVPQQTVPPEQIIEGMIDILGNQLSQTGDKITNQIGDIETQLTVDVVGVVRDTNNEAVDIHEQLKQINATMHQILNKPMTSTGGSALIAIGLMVGVIVGITATVAVAKFFLKVEFFPGQFNKYGVLRGGGGNDLGLGEEDDAAPLRDA